MNVAIFAFIIDTIIGDPRSRFHPVVLIGKLISFLERLYYREADGDQKKFLCGAILVLLVLFITYDVAAGIIYLSSRRCCSPSRFRPRASRRPAAASTHCS